MPDRAESDPSQVTLLLQRLSAGQHSAADDLLPLVYAELHRIARSFFRHQPPGHTLQPTALVNEAYIRFFDHAEPPPLTGRAHFLALMARVMRQILVDHARAVDTAKRFGGLTAAEMALATGKSIHIVQHELRFARAWLRRQMAAE